MLPASREPDAAMRRKPRKGTRSCWECKRRKVRCTYASPSDAVCIGCARRCLECVSQEFPEQRSAPTTTSRLVGDRIGRVEAMVRQLVKQNGTGSGPASASAPAQPSDASPPAHTSPGGEDAMHTDPMPTPASSDAGRSASCTTTSYPDSMDGIIPNCMSVDGLSAVSTCATTREPTPGAAGIGAEHEKISEALLAEYPSQRDIDLLLEVAGPMSIFFFRLFSRPHRVAEALGLGNLDELRVQHTPKSHPVLIARQMLLLSAAVQYANPAADPRLSGMTERPHVIMKRLADTAIRLVATNDSMMGTVEGLECIMLEGVYQSNCGNLRRSWLAWRRAVVLAQLMSLHRHSRPPLRSLQPGYRPDLEHMWSRLMYVDRFLALMLGLPQASLDVSMASPARLKQDTPLGQFERRLCAAASRVVERNERDPSADDSALTHEIDLELQEAARTMPGRWWLAPNIAAVQDDDMQLFWEMSKLFCQIFHYHLLNQLHLPYMLLQAREGPDQQRYDYSRATCVNVSRELLTRYVMFRSFNRIAQCCRVIDFVALSASLTLLLAHLNGHHSECATNVLTHQRLSDRAMMEQVLDNMEIVGALNEDVLSNKSAGLLRQLLAIEADAAAGGSSQRSGPSSSSSSSSEAGTGPKVAGLKLWVPYVGLVTIAQGGMVTKDVHQSQSAPAAPTTSPADFQAPDKSHLQSGLQGIQGSGTVAPPDHSVVMANATPTSIGQQQQQQPPPSEGLAASGILVQQHLLGGENINENANFDQGLAGQGDEFAALQPWYPALTAGSEQWAFQGVDMAFFDSLMRETNAQPGNVASDAWIWPRAA